MRSITSCFRTLIAEPLYWRVAAATLGTLAIALAVVVGVASWPPSNPVEWVGMLLPAVVGLCGAYLLYASTLGNKETFEKATQALDSGSDCASLLILLMVGLVAVPITMMLRRIKRWRAQR